MLSKLDGDWKLVYTSNSELLAILALSKLPFVTIGDITQRIDTAFNTVENKAQISVPLSSTSVSTTASFEVRSPKRLQVKFERGSIQTPQLMADVEVPDSVNVLGQVVDLSQLRGLLQPVSQGLNGIINQVRGRDTEYIESAFGPFVLSEALVSLRNHLQALYTSHATASIHAER